MLPLILAVSAQLLCLAAPGYAARTELVAVEETVSLAPGEARAFDLGLRRNPAVVEASFEVLRGADATLMLVRGAERGEVVRLVSERPAGAIRQALTELDDYQVVLDNRRSRDRRVTVDLRVTLDFDERGLAAPATVSPARRAVIVGASVLFFGLVVFWTGRRLWPAIERRRRDRQLPLY